MSGLSLDPMFVSTYGISGQQTVQKMVEALKASSLSITYDDTTSIFTIFDSSKITKEAIQEIFAKNVYEGWQPKVLDKTDTSGNRLAQLSAISSTHSSVLICLDTSVDGRMIMYAKRKSQ